MHELNNEIDRFGSSEFAASHEIAGAGMYKQSPEAVFLGFDGKRPLWGHGDGGLILCAGARGGKLRDILSYNICSGVLGSVSILILDMKGELACISQDQTPDEKFCRYWNPSALHGMPQDSLNPVDYIHINSPSLVSDVKVFCENMIGLSGAANAGYFERRAREFLEAIILTLVRINGVLDLPSLYHTINLIPGGGDDWLEFGFEMSEAGFEISKRIEEEIAASRKGLSSNGFQGILGEIFKAFACLSDPVLMASVSPPYTMSMADLCASDRKYQMYLMPPAEFIEPWSPVIKAIFVAGMIYKARSPQSPRQLWILDECAQLQKFPLIPKLYSYGAGIGIRPLTVWQTTAQMRTMSPDAETIITSSAAIRMYFAIRDIASATVVSKMLGSQTLEFDDEFKQANARHAKQQAMQAMLSGGDPIAAGLNYAHHKREAELKSKQHRQLRNPSEVMNCPPDKLFLFSDALRKPIYADRKPYYEQRFMNGRFQNNPYHPPADKIRVKTTFGHSWRSIGGAPVPHQFAHYPQYQSGYWRVLGH